MKAAGKAMSVLSRIKSTSLAKQNSIRSTKTKDRLGMKRAMSSLFSSSRGKKSRGKPAWKHTFVCLAYHDQERIPTTELEKDELFEAGLGVHEVEFDSLDLTAEDFCDVMCESYPQLKGCGGYMFFKCTPNSRKLEPLSKAVYS